MSVDHFSSGVTPPMSEPSLSRSKRWRGRWRHLRARARPVALFASGVAAALVTAAQPEDDIAVLRARQPPAHIVPATLGNPNAMTVGDEAYVVGNPFGLYGSMSAGVISGFNRAFRPVDSTYKLHDLIQID